jgi:hypothetical protein
MHLLAPEVPCRTWFGWGLAGCGCGVFHSAPRRPRCWIFGDTLYGRHRSVVGNEPRMVHNSLGISTCDANGHWHMQYVLKRDRNGRPLSYFSPRNSQDWYWAMDGFTAHGDLFVTLLCIRKSNSSEPNGLGFKTCGSDLAHVAHLVANPQEWTISIKTLDQTTSTLIRPLRPSCSVNMHIYSLSTSTGHARCSSHAYHLTGLICQSLSCNI